MDYLDNIDLDLDSYEILGVEKKVEFELFGKRFVGYIDLLLRDKQTDEIIIVDHKSASIKILKNGNISKSDQSGRKSRVCDADNDTDAYTAGSTNEKTGAGRN